jgi:hypothetical protein
MFQYNERGEMQGIFNEQTAGLNYQINQSGNLVKSQQNASRKNLWQVQKVSYTSAFANSRIDTSCPFGDGFYTGGDGGIEWGNWDNYFAKFVEGENCYDPFAGMFGGGGGKTCEQCRTDNKSACDDDAISKIAAEGLLGLGIIVGCSWTGPGELVCFGVVVVLAILGGVDVYFSHRACYKRVDNNCPQCN